MAKKRVNSRRKGVKGEQKAALFLRSLGFPDAERTEQHSGRGGEIGDVHCPESLPNVHFEVKFGVKGLDLETKLFDEAVEQAKRDCPERKKWVLLWKVPRGQFWRMTYDEGCHGVVTVSCRKDSYAFLKTILGYLNFRGM